MDILPNPARELMVTVTAPNGQVVSAPLSKWVTQLICARPMDEIVALCEMVAGRAHSPFVAHVVDPNLIRPSIPADPNEFLRQRPGHTSNRAHSHGIPGRRR